VHVNEHGVRKADPSVGVVATDAGGVAPAVIEAVMLDRLTVRETLQAFGHHDYRRDRRRNRASSTLLKEIGELLVGK
jgi:hypothetical protein